MAQTNDLRARLMGNTRRFRVTLKMDDHAALQTWVGVPSLFDQKRFKLHVEGIGTLKVSYAYVVTLDELPDEVSSAGKGP